MKRSAGNKDGGQNQRLPGPPRGHIAGGRPEEKGALRAGGHENSCCWERRGRADARGPRTGCGPLLKLGLAVWVYLCLFSGLCSCLNILHSETLGKHTHERVLELSSARGSGDAVRKVTDSEPLPRPGPRTYRGHTAAVYQEKRYWQSAVSWLNSGIPSFIKGSQ